MLLTLGGRSYDLTTRALVVGVLRPGHLCRQADELVAAGADVLDVATAADAGTLHERVGVPVSITTSRASVAADAYRAGAALGNDPSGFADPDFLRATADAGAAVVAAHPGGGGAYDFLAERVARARVAGIPDDRILLNAPLHSAELLAGSARLAELGVPLQLTVSNEEPGASVALLSVGVSLGCRILRVRDVLAARRVRDALAAVLEAS